MLVWVEDRVTINNIQMKHGFLYLPAVIDWHSRCIVGWELDDIKLYLSMYRKY